MAVSLWIANFLLLSQSHPAPMKFLRLLLILLLTTPRVFAAAEPTLFERSNLVAWCIVPFDAKKRGPEERAAMLEKLGVKRLAYDYRAEHVPQFDAEMEALKRHGIELTAWWFPTAMNDEARLILDVIKRHGVKPQLWVMGSGGRVEDEAARLRPICEAAAAHGLKVALYNHGGWFGEPENQLAIIARLKTDGITNCGIVYNLHHGHHRAADFPALLEKMKPHLLALNLNGTVRGGEASGQKIVPLAQGDMDVALLRAIQNSSWQGPVGILNHTDEDAEARLLDNLDGLDWLVKELAKPGSGGAKPSPRSWKRPANAAPLEPERWPNRTHPVNRERLYDFYLKQAADWRAQPRAVMPEFPGLDGGRLGHWGNQNEETWRDGRWNAMDCGPCMAGVFRSGKWTIPKAVCVRLGANGERSAVYDPQADEWRVLWQGGFVKFTDVRHGCRASTATGTA